MTPLLRRSLRRGALAAAAILAIAGTLVVAYELAVARVPEHRAALERLVRAQTGLDVRFNELSLRWGWYGPEAVFRRVELGEPGRSNVLLRAPELVVGFDAWRTMQTGQLAAGRITLVAPDIDLERLSQPEHAPPARIPTRAAATNGESALERRARILERWRGGRIELQGGTLKVPDPAGSANPITVQVRRASLRRSEDEWNGFGLVFLPERLGRAARLAVQVQGDITKPRTLTGSVRFEGMRLAFSGWREMFGTNPWITRTLPTTGGGDVTLQLTLKSGRIEKANGQVKVNDITLGTPPWLDPAQAVAGTHGVLSVDYVSGDWRFVSRPGGGQVQLEQLVLGREDKDSPLPNIAIEVGEGRVHGSVAKAPLRSVAAIARWLAPGLVPSGVVLGGTAEDIDFDWSTARVDGERLAASALVKEARIAGTSSGFALSGITTRLTGSESRLVIEMQAPAARLELASLPKQPVEPLKLESVLQLTRSADGWQLSTERLSVEHESGHMMMRGSVTSTAGSDMPVLDAQGTVPHANVAKLRDILAAETPRVLGAAVSRLTAGVIDDARFTLQGPVDELLPNGFKGSLTLSDARLANEGAWPEAHALHAKLDWTGPRLRISADEGRAGAFDLDGIEAQWDVSGTRASRVTGRARARLEHALAWLRAHPEVQEHTPRLGDIAARGDALFDFDFTMPAQVVHAPRSTPPKPRTHVAVVLEGAQLRLASEMPAIEAMRGSLAFDSGRLQRSTLSATWLGSPLTLKVVERRGGVLAVQAQGYVDAQKLVALSQVKDLPTVSGETPWSGEFLYTPPTGTKPLKWQGRADSTLVGVASDLPAPFNKLADATLPLHLEVSGTSEASEVRVNLAERLRSAFALKTAQGGEWQIDRGAIRVGGGAVTLPTDQVISIDGRLKRLDLPAYLVAWQQVGALAEATPAEIDLTADELIVGGRAHVNATLQASPVDGGTGVRVESQSLGALTGTLVSGGPGISFREVKWTRDTLSGEGTIDCGAGLATCDATFEMSTDSAARALADLGFRADLAAAKGSMSGQLTWQPRSERPWLETASGTLTMRFDDGIARSSVATSGHPFALLTVPALLSGIPWSAGPEAAMPAGELRFRRLDAEFELREGQAYTSNLHFDGDAEILMRGRTGLLTRDYDHEAWVLRGEERIPASLRRLAATPRVAAAWMTLRELIRGEAANRSHVVLHLRGSWNDPVVTVE